MTRRDQLQAIRDLAATWEPRIRRAFIESVERLQESINLEQLAADIQRYGASVFTDDILASRYQPLVDAVVAATVAAGSTFAPFAESSIGGVLPASRRPLGGLTVQFNALNPSTTDYLRDYSAQLVRQISEETRQTVTQIVNRGVTAGDNPLTIAREIRDHIGLTARQEAAIRNFRDMLESRSREVLDRALRDKRFDSTIRRAIENDVPLTDEQINRMVARYRERYVRYRSEVIGRTEAMRAASSGSDLLWRQQVDAGLVLPEQVRREWVYTHDGKTRPAHRAIPSMNPDGVGLDESFKSPEGLIRFPHDPAAPASMTVQCRCTVFTRAVSLELL